jgi:flagellar assembly protein FliH
MSDPAFAHDFSGAQAVPVWTRPRHHAFAAADRAAPGGFSAWVDRQEEPDPEPSSNPGADSLIEQGYALGLAEGRRVAEARLAEDYAAVARLMQSLEALQPEPPVALAAMLSASVRRLVAQIVGEVEVNAETLAERTLAVATVITDEASPSRLRLHPDDAARLEGLPLPLEILPDPTMPPGAILVETGSGWIEDGPAVRLEKLGLALDRMGAPR